MKAATLLPHSRNIYHRTVAMVVLPDSTNVNHKLIKDGWCWWYWKYALGKYHAGMVRN